MIGRLPTAEQGGWTPESIQVQAGERVILRLSSNDVVHGFAVPKLGIDVGWVQPGKVTEIEFVAGEPGRYDFLCTVWCEAGHWRMRGVIEVVDPDDPLALLSDPSPPQTDWVATGIDIDAEHAAANSPSSRPDAATGEQLWTNLTDQPLTAVLIDLDLRLLTPADLFTRLPELAQGTGATAGNLSESERWDIVAYLWSTRISADNLVAAESNFRRDCTGCHGLEGRGDGPGAEPEIHLEHGHDDMTRPATNFTDLAAQMGAADMTYYGKLVRGGMGTSMPHWGGIYTEDELWALVAYLRSFAFDYSNVPE